MPRPPELAEEVCRRDLLLLCERRRCPCVAVLDPVRCSLLLLVRPAEEMCGVEHAACGKARSTSLCGEQEWREESGGER